MAPTKLATTIVAIVISGTLIPATILATSGDGRLMGALSNPLSRPIAFAGPNGDRTIVFPWVMRTLATRHVRWEDPGCRSPWRAGLRGCYGGYAPSRSRESHKSHLGTHPT